jgi:hypothetical protein
MLVGGGLYLFYRPQITDWIESLIAKEEQEVETPTESFVCDGEVYQNTKQGYKVCYVSGWDTMEFGYSKLNVGFDPYTIPEASEYPGMILVSVSHESSASLLAGYLANLEDPTTAAAEVDGIVGIEIAGTFPSDAIFFSDYFQVVTVMENLSRTYTIQLLSSPDNYESNLLTYQNFVDSFTFLSGISSPPWGEDIYLLSPWPGDTVGSPLAVVGEAQGAFENTVTSRLKNANGEVIVETPVTYTTSEPGQLGSFSVDLIFTTATSEGTLEVYHTSAKDGSILDLVSVPLKFGK